MLNFLIELIKNEDTLKVNNLKLVSTDDCKLAYQMGYKAKIKNGQVVEFTKEEM